MPLCIVPVETIHRHVFSDEIYPGQPFRNPTWIGIAFDRDKHDYLRFPDNVLRIFLGAAAESSSSRALVHGLGVNFSTSVSGEGTVEVDLNPDEYVRMVRDDRRYSPEYKIAEVTGAWGMWLHWDWSILGGPRVLMSKVFAALGGEERVWADIDDEFALSQVPSDPQLDLYLQTLLGRGASAA